MLEMMKNVIKALQRVEIKATYENLNIMLGCIQRLQQIAEQMTEGEDDGRQTNHSESGT